MNRPYGSAASRWSFFLVLFSLLSGHSASAATGLEWLTSQSNPDGSYSAGNDVADPIQATSEAVQTLRVLGQSSQPGFSTALQFLNAQSHHTTEVLARKIIANKIAGNNPSPLTAELRAAQNFDGGFGDLAGFDSTVLDTSFALLAFGEAGGVTNTVIAEALGYLMSQQNADGSFRLAYRDTNSVYVTAMAFSAMHRFSLYFSVTANVDKARAFLLNRQLTTGGWSSDWETAFVLNTIVPATSDASKYAAAAAALSSAQRADGSWGGDVYATALALRALNAVSTKSIPPSPQGGTLAGKLIDATNGQPVSGAVVKLLENTALQSITGNDGVFSIGYVPGGTYTVDVQLSGYAGIVTTATIASGQLLNVGVLALSPLNTSSIVTGRVTNATAGTAIAGATVVVSGTGTVAGTTDGNGSYRLVVTPGAVSISVQATGYDGATANGNLIAGTVVTFSPALHVAGTTPSNAPVTVRGRARDNNTGNAIAGVAASVAGAAISTLSDATGAFELSNLTAGEYRVDLEKSGYQSVHVSVLAGAGATVELGDVRLSPIGITSIITGHVIESGSGQPINGATVTVSTGNAAISAVDGSFRIEGVVGTQFQVNASAVGYLSSSANVTLSQPGTANVEFSLTRAASTDFSISALTSDSPSYDAHAEVQLSAVLDNLGTTARSVRLNIKVLDVLNAVIEQFPAVSVPLGADPQAAIRIVPASGQLTDEVEWNTSSYAAGAYTLVVQAIDANNGQLLDERGVRVDVRVTRRIGGLAEFDPPIAQLAAHAPVRMIANVDNSGNEPIGPAAVTAVVKLKNLGFQSQATGYQVSDLGSGSFNNARSLSVDSAGNLYIPTCNDNTVWKIVPGSAATVFATGFNCPQDVAIDSSGTVYVLNNNASFVRITAAGVRSTVLTGISAQKRIEVMSDGRVMIAIVDGLYEVNPSGVVTKVISKGMAAPKGIAFDSHGDLFIANSGDGSILKLSGGLLTPFITGIASPYGIAIDGNDNLYVTSIGSNALYKITPQGSVSTFATGLSSPMDVRIASDGSLVVSNNGSSEITKIAPGGTITTLVRETINGPDNAGFDSAGNLIVANNGSQRIRRFDTNGTISDLATGISTNDIHVLPDGSVVAAETTGAVTRITSGGVRTVLATGLSSSLGIHPAPDNDGVLVGQSSGHRLARVSSSGVVSTYLESHFYGAGGMRVDAAGRLHIFKGDGGITVLEASGDASFLKMPVSSMQGLAIDAAGDFIVPDLTGKRVLRVSKTGAVTALTGTLAFNPYEVAVSGSGAVFVATQNSTTIYAVGAGGVLTPYAVVANAIQGDMVADSYGTIWASGASSRLTRIATDGTQTVFSLRGVPASIFPDGSGGVVVANSNWVQAVSASGVVADVLVAGALSGQSLTGVARDSAGHLWTLATQGIALQFNADLSVNKRYGTLNQPADIAYIGTDLYVVDTGYDKVLRFTAPNRLAEIVADGTFERIAVESPDSLLLSKSNLVQRLTLSTGALVNVATGFSSAMALAIGPDGIIAVGDANLNELSRYSASGTLLSRYVGIVKPRGIALLDDGRMLIANSKPNSIAVMASTGNTTTFASGAVDYFLINSDGSVTTTQSSNIVTYSSTGTKLSTTAVVATLRGIARDAQGTLFVAADKTPAAILKSGASGFSTVATGLSSVSDMALDSGGMLHIADSTAGAVARLTSAYAMEVVADNVGSVSAISFDPNGRLYVAYSTNVLSVFGEDGARIDLPTAGLLGQAVTGLANLSASELIGMQTTTSSSSLFKLQEPVAVAEVGVDDIVFTASANLPRIEPGAIAVPIDFGTWIPDLSGDFELSVQSADGSVDGTLFNTLHVGPNASGQFSVASSTFSPGTHTAAANLRITGADSTSVTKVDATGTTLAAISGAQGRAVAADSSGNIFAAGSNNIVKITPSGVVSTFVSGFAVGEGMAVDADDNLYAISNTTIRKITPQGVASILATFPTTVYGVAVGYDNEIYAVDNYDRLVHVSNSGALEVVSTTGINNPQGVTIDAFGTFYVLNQNNAITKLTADRKATILFNKAKFEFEGVNVTADCANNLLFAPYELLPEKKSGEESMIMQLIGDTGETRVVLNGPTIDPAMSDMDVVYYDRKGHRLLIWTDLNNGKVFSFPVICGGIAVTAHVVTRSDVDLMSTVPAPTSVVDRADGTKEYVWNLSDVDITGQDIQLNLTLKSLTDGESRPIFADAFLEYANSFASGQVVRVPMAVPHVQSVLAVQVVPALDAALYGPDAPANVTVNITNDNADSFSGSLLISVQDSAGNLVADLGSYAVNSIAAGAVSQVTAAWNTGATYAGDYKVVAELYNSLGVLAKTGITLFAIQATAVGSSDKAIELSVYPDKQSYQAWDSVDIAARVRNIATNLLLNPSVSNVTVKTPASATLFTGAANNGQLVAGALSDQNFALSLSDAAAGTYPIMLIATDAATGSVLGAASASFQVNRLNVRSLTGHVAVLHRSVYVGDANSCTDTITNLSSTAVANATIKFLLLQGDTGTVVSETETTMNLAAGASQTLTRAINTAGYTLGGFACILQATVDGATQTLGFESFQVLKQPNVAPTANAGPDQSGPVGTIFLLSGMASTDADGNPLTYRWRIVSRPDGSTAVLSSDSQVITQLTADRKGTYVVELNVNDGLVDSTPSLVTLNVVNSAPIAIAGVDQSGYLGDVVTLNGSASTDIDGDPLTYSWTILSAPSGSTSTLSAPNAVETTLKLNRHGSYTIQLIVNDGTVDSLPSSLVINVKNRIPVADAGADVAANVGETVALDGRASSDPDNDPLTFAWSFVSVPAGSHAQFANAGSAQPIFVPDLAGVYIASLTVNDGLSDSAADFVTITIVSPKPEITSEFRIGGKHRVLALLGKPIPSETVVADSTDCHRTTRIELDASFTAALDANAQVLVEVYDAAHHLLDSENVTLSQFVSAANSVLGADVDLSVTSFDATHLTVTLREPDIAHTLHDGLTVVATVWNGGAVETLSTGNLALECGHSVAANTEVGSFRVFNVWTTANDANLAPAYEQQRAFLEALLKREGWMVRVVDNAADFTREMRTGTYGLYLVLSGGDKLEETTQKELREAVFNGEGLLVANGHDNRNHGLAAALGTKFKGDDPKTTGIQLLNSDLGAAADANFAFDEHFLRIDLNGAVAAGQYTYPASADVSVAATTFDYGHGRSVHLGFDAVGHATAMGETSVFANLIADALVYINPPIETRAGQVVELELTLTDKKIAAGGQVEITLPEGFTLVDSLTVDAPVNGVITWPFDLAEGESKQLRLAVRLPESAGAQTVTGMVKIRNGAALEDYATLSLNITVTATATMAETLDLATTLSALKKATVNYGDVLRSVKQAQSNIDSAQYDAALKELAKTTDKLLNAGSADADRLRHRIDDVIRGVERKL